MSSERESKKMTVQEYLDEKDANGDAKYLKAKDVGQKVQAKAGHEALSQLDDVVASIGLTNTCGIVVLGPSRSKAGSDSWIQESFGRLAEDVMNAKRDLERVLEETQAVKNVIGQTEAGKTNVREKLVILDEKAISIGVRLAQARDAIGGLPLSDIEARTAGWNAEQTVAIAELRSWVMGTCELPGCTSNSGPSVGENIGVVGMPLDKNYERLNKKEFQTLFHEKTLLPKKGGAVHDHLTKVQLLIDNVAKAWDSDNNENRGNEIMDDIEKQCSSVEIQSGLRTAWQGETVDIKDLYPFQWLKTRPVTEDANAGSQFPGSSSVGYSKNKGKGNANAHGSSSTGNAKGKGKTENNRDNSLEPDRDAEFYTDKNTGKVFKKESASELWSDTESKYEIVVDETASMGTIGKCRAVIAKIRCEMKLRGNGHLNSPDGQLDVMLLRDMFNFATGSGYVSTRGT
jgi:hypothetical protein